VDKEPTPPKVGDVYIFRAKRTNVKVDEIRRYVVRCITSTGSIVDWSDEDFIEDIRDGFLVLLTEDEKPRIGDVYTERATGYKYTVLTIGGESRVIFSVVPSVVPPSYINARSYTQFAESIKKGDFVLQNRSE
jgi:hypothetical protein